MTRSVAGVLLAVLACSSPPGAADDAAVGAPTPDALPIDAPVPDGAPADADGTGLLPDITVNLARAEVDLALREKVFDPGACELDPDEACITAPGVRRLLHFAVETPNIGEGDMVLGQPSDDNEHFVYSACHDHYHFEGYAAYRLYDSGGAEVAVGRKQAFCLLDSERYITDDPTVATSPRYSCGNQGIQRGWADVYHARLPCQFIDITGVSDGAYRLEIELNSERLLEESSYDNNLVSIPVVIGAAELATPTEECPPGVDEHSSQGEHRECGWQLAETFDCMPGVQLSVGCASACGLGTCTGDPMLRVCDPARPDGNCSYPAAVGTGDDFNGQCPCDLSVDCPESGQIAVYTAPFRIGEPMECNLAIEE